MTESGMPFDELLVGDATKAPYTSAEWARMWALMHDTGPFFPNYGVFEGSGDGTYDALHVLATSPASSNVEVQPGAALVNGRFYESTAAVTLPVASNASGNPRIDTVALRLDVIAQTIRLVVRQGTPAGSPVRPTLQQDATIWEIPLADIAVANGFSTLAQSVISQRQQIMGTQTRGWQAYAFPQNYVSSTALSSSLSVVPGSTVLVPFLLTGNMLLKSVTVQHVIANGVAFEYGWDVYVQDTNDGIAAENSIRRVAQSNGNNAAVSTGAAYSILAALGGAVRLTPGVYWLAFQNRHATNNFVLAYTVTGGFDNAIPYVKTKVTTNPNGQTLDAVTGWSTTNYVPGLLFTGRVFGQP